MTINGIQLNVDVQGEGPPLVLLHGIGLDLTSWDRETALLTPRFKVIRLDARGHGLSDKPEKIALADHVADVWGVLDALGVSSAAVLGASMGSYIAQGVAIARPSSVTKLILVVTRAHAERSGVMRLIEAHRAELVGLTSEEQQAFIFNLGFAPDTPKAKREAAHAIVQRCTQLTPTQFFAASAAISGMDHRPDLPKITADTLVIAGRHDQLNPPEEGRACAELIPDATFIEFDRSGHMPQFEEPDRFMAFVENFMIS